MRSGTSGFGVTCLVAAIIWIGAGDRAHTFHSGGVGECSGCHSMHAPKPGNSFMLIGADASTTCLVCHMSAGDAGPSGHHIATPDSDMPVGTAPRQRTPGGDFGWLRKSYAMTIRGATVTEAGESHGHN